MKPATEILLSAAFVLTPEENWTTGTFAISKTGRSVWYYDRAACAWCLDGALKESAAQSTDPRYYSAAYDILMRAVNQSPIHFNDTHTHAEVLAALYKAAELSEAS